MTDQTINATPRRVDAMTIDEYYEARDNAPPLPSHRGGSGEAKATGEIRTVFDLDQAPLAVRLNVDASCFAFQFAGRVANLDLVATKNLCASIIDELERMRDDIEGTHDADA